MFRWVKISPLPALREGHHEKPNILWGHNCGIQDGSNCCPLSLLKQQVPKNFLWGRKFPCLWESLFQQRHWIGVMEWCQSQWMDLSWRHSSSRWYVNLTMNYCFFPRFFFKFENGNQCHYITRFKIFIKMITCFRSLAKISWTIFRTENLLESFSRLYFYSLIFCMFFDNFECIQRFSVANDPKWVFLREADEFDWISSIKIKYKPIVLQQGMQSVNLSLVEILLSYQRFSTFFKNTFAMVPKS